MVDFKNILMFCAHPDDEVIGGGGVLKKFSELGAHITVVIATGGETGISENYNNINDISTVRGAESQSSASILGVDELLLWNNKTQELTNNKGLLHDVIKVIRKIKPDLVLTHSHDDKHRDHKCLSLVTCEGVWKAWENILPSLGERHRVREIWAFEVVDPFSYPDIIVDITNYLQYKIDAMEVHNSQHDVLGGSNEICNYITGLAMVRGYLNGCKYGEAFKICNILPRSI